MQKEKGKIIVALDVADINSAKMIVEKIGDEVSFYKIGLELLMSGEYFQLISWLKEKNKKVFADLKLYDISETIAKAVKNMARHDVDILTIHTSSSSIMRAAAENKGKMQVVGVTVLTNLDQNDLIEMGFDSQISLQDLVNKKAALALDCGLDGVVSSANEAKNLRLKFGTNFTIITPGIRLDKVENDDQKRVCDVKSAILNGSSYLVVGRPITQSQDPKAEAIKFNTQILQCN